MNTLLVSLVLTLSVQQQIEGGEIGDGPFHLTFNAGGKYAALKHDKAAGNSSADGTWSISGDALEVKVASCKGPACKELGASYKSSISLVSERVMTVRTVPSSAAFGTGAYYCRYQGCAKRHGLMVTAHKAKPLAVRSVVDFLVDKNRARDSLSHADRALAGSAWVEPTDDDKPSETTVVWEGAPLTSAQGASSLTYCARDAARGKKAAEQLASDVAELTWLGKLTPKPSTEASCVFDVQLVIGDDAKIPARK